MITSELYGFFFFFFSVFIVNIPNPIKWSLPVPCRCLVHVVRSANVRYSKVRPLHPLCQFDVCRHEVRYGCQREDSCSFAHSVIELKCWVLQQDTGGLFILF